jgi:hypothetical protein
MRGWVCHLQLLLALTSEVILRSESSRSHDHILLSEIRDCSNLEGQVLVFISHRNRVAHLYPPALGSLFIIFYDLLGYGGGIRTCLHAGITATSKSYDMTDSQSISMSWCQAPIWGPRADFYYCQTVAKWSCLYHFGMDCVENASTIIAAFSCCRGNMLVFGVVT